jgi:hypothetical protein
MAYIVQGTLLLAQGTEQNQDKLLGYPLAGVHVGGGRHVPMPPTWDGNGAVPIGWTSYRGSSRQHPTLPQYATPLDPDAPNAMANGRRARLNTAEQAKMTADLAGAVPQLPGDWFPAGAQAVAAEGGRS